MPRMGKGYLPLLYIPDGAGRYIKLPSLTTAQRDALTAIKGMIIWNSTTSALNQYNGSSWGTVGVSDHGALSGLTDDDHTQYLLGSGGGRECVIVRKAADQTLDQESTTLQNVTEMLFAVAANEAWVFEAHIISNSGTTPDIKFGFTAPSGATLLWGLFSVNSSLGSGDSYDETGAGYDLLMRPFHGIVLVGATPGNIQLQAAQRVSNASDTKVLANSCIIAHRLV